MTLEAVFFDLDNTLLLYSEQDFYQKYIQGLSMHFTDLMSPEFFSGKMMESTKVMVKNDGSRTNLEVFLGAFSNGTGETDTQLMARFDSYYRDEFQHFRDLMQPVAGISKIFDLLNANRIKTVIATNPMFPMPVQELKIKWAGLDSARLDLITSVENSSFCKPNPNYYQSICDKIKVTPENCLMVGNDPLNDMIATSLGIKTYLTNDSAQLSIELSHKLALKDRDDLPEPDYTGSFISLLPVITDILE